MRTALSARGVRPLPLRVLGVLEVVGAVSGDRAVVALRGLRPRGHVEIHRALGSVGEAIIDEPLHVVDHLGDMACGARFHTRGKHAELGVGAVELALVRGHPLPPRAAVFIGLGEDLVVDIGDVANERDVKPLG